MNTNQITPFLFGDSTIRTLIKNGEPWFVAKDVCEILALGNSSMAVNGNHKSGNLGLDEEEKGIMIHETTGGPQEMLTVNESGLYALIFKSRKLEARRFRKWVTSEVLPAIRRSGSYHRGHQAFLGLLKDQIALGVTPDLAARLAGKLTGIPREEILPPAAITSRQDSEIEFLLALMKPGVSYTTHDLVKLIPITSTLSEGSLSSRGSRIGKILNRACRHQRLEKIHGRHNAYRLPSIADFKTANT